jgi:hypothetical protein
MASTVSKVINNLERQGAGLGNVVREAAKKTLGAAPYLVNPELKAGTTALKIGDKVAQKVAESMPAGKVGKAGGELKSIRVNGPATITAKSMSKTVVPEAKKIDITTPKRTPDQRLGEQKGQDTNRANAIEGAAITATNAAHPEVKQLAQSGTKAINATKLAATAVTKITQPAANSNPVRKAGDSSTKYHPDNKPAMGNK